MAAGVTDRLFDVMDLVNPLIESEHEDAASSARLKLQMKPVRSGPRAILLSLALALLIIGSAQWVAVVTVYVMGPPPAEPDPLILVVVAALTLGPSIALGIATRRARVVAASWDLGKVGGNVLMFVSILMAAILGIAGLYPVVRLVKIFAAN